MQIPLRLRVAKRRIKSSTKLPTQHIQCVGLVIRRSRTTDKQTNKNETKQKKQQQQQILLSEW